MGKGEDDKTARVDRPAKVREGLRGKLRIPFYISKFEFHIKFTNSGS